MNPIKTSDLYKDTGELEKLEEQLMNVEETYTQLISSVKRNASQLNTELGRTTTATASQREQIKSTAAQTEVLEKALGKYNAALSENAVELAAVREATRIQNQVNKLSGKLNSSLEGSYNKLSAQYSLNKIRLNQMSKAQREATEEGRELVKESAKLREEMNRLQKETGNYTLQVGNYTLVNDRLLDQLEQMPGLTGQTTSGIRGMGKQLSALARNPVLLFVTALVAGVGALVKAFFRSEEGTIAYRKGLAALEGVKSSLVKVTLNLKDAIVDTFREPVSTLKSFGQNFIKFVTDPIGSITRGAQNASNALKKVTEEVMSQVDAFIELDELRRQNIRTNRQLERSIAAITAKEEELKQRAGDATLSFKEQREAAEAAAAEIQKRAQLQIRLQRSNLDLINTEINLRRSNGEAVNELLDQQVDAYKGLIRAESEYTLAIAQNETERRQIKQDELERDLDILIDGFDNQKRVNELLLQNDNLTIEERARILADTSDLANASFEKQIETIQKFTKVQVDANDLIKESDAVVLNQKIRSLGLSEVIEGRLLEIVRERRIAIVELAQAEQQLSRERTEQAQKEIELQEKLNQESIDRRLADFDELQKLEEAKFKLTERTEAELTKFRLEQERKRLGEILDLNEEFFGDLSQTQIQTLRTRIQGIDNLLSNLGGGTETRSIFDLIGIDLSDDQQQGLTAAFNLAKQQLLQFASLRSQIAQQEVQQSQNRVQQLQAELQTQLQLDAQGYASRVDTVRRELDLARDAQREALEEQRKAQRAEQRIAAAQQAVQLTLATARIWGQLGFPAAFGAIALMWGSFIAAQVRAAQLTKREFSEGGYEEIGGGSHRSGDDTYLGFSVKGQPAFAERGEAHAVFNPKAVKKYRSELPRIVDQINRGDFTAQYIDKTARVIPIDIGARPSIDMSTSEAYLKQIAEQGQRQVHFDGSGNMVIVDGNRTIIRRTA